MLKLMIKVMLKKVINLAIDLILKSVIDLFMKLMINLMINIILMSVATMSVPMRNHRGLHVVPLAILAGIVNLIFSLFCCLLLLVVA
jgi:hypothetical protein